MALVQCSECSGQVSNLASACPHCGAPLKEGAAARPLVVTAPKSRSVAILLAIFLGGLGLHKFYLNRPGVGLLYILFCWTFIPALIGLIEGLGYALMSEDSFQEQYGGRAPRAPKEHSSFRLS